MGGTWREFTRLDRFEREQAVLEVLKDGKARTVLELAKELGTTLPTMSKVIYGMEIKKLISVKHIGRMKIVMKNEERT